MKITLIKTTDKGIVGIVTAMLLISLIVTVISIFQLVYVPKIMEEREIEHLDRVAEQFGFLASVIFDQVVVQNKVIPSATFVTLGSNELPFLISSKAFGTLEILENSSKLTIRDSIYNTFKIGTIDYSSSNVYYLDQSYSYEAGALIVSQSQGNKMLVRPSLLVDYNKISNVVNISFDVVNISSIREKTIVAGSGISVIQTQFDYISKNLTFIDIQNMTIDTNFPNAWFTFLNNSLLEAGLNVDQFIFTKMDKAIDLDFISSLIVNINIKIIEINAQIGPGLIE